MNADVAGRQILFSPFESEKLSLPNRIVMSPMGRAHAPGGRPDSAYGAYFRRRIEGGASLAITGAAAIAHQLSDYDGSGPHFFGDEALSSWSAVLDQVHGASGKLIPQLWHSGMERRVEFFVESEAIGPSGLSIADLDANRDPSGRSMGARDLEAVIDAFATTALNARERGFDGVEIHAGHGFLLDQFLWSRTNRRTDEYGGSPERRAHFPARVIAACRAAVGQDFPILVRISQFKIGAYEARVGETPQELERLIFPLADAGADIFHCSQREAWEPAFDGSNLNLAGWVKKLTGKPTITVGSMGLGGLFTENEAATPGDDLPAISLGHLETICSMIERGEVDLMAVGRALLADADWPRKVQQGRDNELNALNVAALTTLQ